jgi:hypothetical protein
VKRAAEPMPGLTRAPIEPHASSSAADTKTRGILREDRSCFPASRFRFSAPQRGIPSHAAAVRQRPARAPSRIARRCWLWISGMSLASAAGLPIVSRLKMTRGALTVTAAASRVEVGCCGRKPSRPRVRSGLRSKPPSRGRMGRDRPKSRCPVLGRTVRSRARCEGQPRHSSAHAQRQKPDRPT